VAAVKTPTIFFVGGATPSPDAPIGGDVSRAQGNGVDTHLYIAPREPHGWAELRHQLFKLNAEIDGSKSTRPSGRSRGESPG
jgi:hypothetical protein